MTPTVASPGLPGVRKGWAKSFEKQSYPGPTQIPNAADALGVDPSRSEPWWLLAPNTADRPVMKRGSSSGTARMLANCAPVTQPHSNMQPIDKASSESNLRESRRGLNVNAMTL
ncbi:hypothetical protein Neosp_008161 [[Neocosmospora] mangrovei]